MNELTEKLWPAFRAEVTEQLEAIEIALIGGGADANVDVNSLFRHFHTVKGGCAMMGFANMGAVAHASEDILDPVRKGQRRLDEALVDALLQALDALKAQMEIAVRNRQDPPARTDIIERLRSLAGAAPVAAAARTDPRAEPRPRRTTRAVTARDDSPGTRGKGLEIGGFALVAREVIPELLAAGLSDAVPGATSEALAARLETAAMDAGVSAIANLLSKRHQAFADPYKRMALLGDLADRLAYLETTAGVDCGVESVAAALRDQHRDAMARAIADLATAVSPLALPGGVGVAGDIAVAALSRVDTVLACALLLRLPRTARLMRAVAQVMREVARSTVGLSVELGELLVVASTLPAELHGGIEEDAPYDAMCAQVLDRLHQLASSLTKGTDLLERCGRIRSRIDISQDVLDTLLPHAVTLLEEAVDRKETIFEIEADLESTADGGEEFVGWLSNAGTIVSNHTVFHRETAGGLHRQSTRLRFVASSTATLDEIKHALGELDPGQRLFDLTHCAFLAVNAGVIPDASSPAPEGIQAPAMTGAAQPQGAAGNAASSTLRIDSATLDRFVNRVGEMVMLRNMMAHALGTEDVSARHRRARSLLSSRSANRPLSDAELAEMRELLDELDERHERLAQTDVRVQGALGRMQEDVLALRVVPIGVVFNRMPRVVRDVSQAQRKQANIEISGEDVRIDKSLVDVLVEPLMHLVRNAVDHGLETPAERQALGKPATGTLSLIARQQGNMLLVEVTDDGRGLDLDRIRAKAIAAGISSAGDVAGMSEREVCNLVFLPGFSTAERVTEVSGRGVGMDVVKTRIVQVGGQVDVRSVAGQGASFTLRLPLTVAIQSVILVTSGDRQLAIPERSVAEVISIPARALQTVQGQACCLLRTATLPLYNLGQLLGEAGATRQSDSTLEVVVLTDGAYRIGVIVDRVIGRPEVFVRDIHPDLARVPGVGGASILGDGSVVIIVDCENLFELAIRNAQSLRSLLRAS